MWQNKLNLNWNWNCALVLLETNNRIFLRDICREYHLFYFKIGQISSSHLLVKLCLTVCKSSYVDVINHASCIHYSRINFIPSHHRVISSVYYMKYSCIPDGSKIRKMKSPLSQEAVPFLATHVWYHFWTNQLLAFSRGFQWSVRAVLWVVCCF